MRAARRDIVGDLAVAGIGFPGRVDLAHDGATVRPWSLSPSREQGRTQRSGLVGPAVPGRREDVRGGDELRMIVGQPGDPAVLAKP